MFKRLNQTTGVAPMNSNGKVIWLAIIARGSGFGYPLLVARYETLQSYRNWARCSCQKFIGEFPTQQQARKRIDAWSHPGL
jgi:hypothetical protein